MFSRYNKLTKVNLSKFKLKLKLIYIFMNFNVNILKVKWKTTERRHNFCLKVSC